MAPALRERQRLGRTCNATTSHDAAPSQHGARRPLDAQCRLRQDDGHGQVPKSHEHSAYAIVFLENNQTTVHFHDYLDTYRVSYHKKSEGRPDWL